MLLKASFAKTEGGFSIIFRTNKLAKLRRHTNRVHFSSNNTNKAIMIKTYFRSFVGLSRTLPTTSYAKMIDIWMIFCMLNPFSEVFIHAIRHGLKNSRWTSKASVGVEEMLVKRRLVTVIGISMVTVAILFLAIYWVLALYYYFAISTTSMVTSESQSCIYQFV